MLAFAVFFFKIIIYLAISLVLFLVGYPLTYRIEKIKIGNKKLPDSMAALITIIVIIGLVSGLFLVIIPPLVGEIKFLSALNFHEVLQNVLAQFPGLKSVYLNLGMKKT